MKRTLWFAPVLDAVDKGHIDPENYDLAEERRQVDHENEANMVGSLCESGLHAPVLDIDYGARLVPSSTEGHFHLYLDREVPWEKFVVVLEAMADAGLIEPGYVEASKREDRRMTFARLRPTKPPAVVA